MMRHVFSFLGAIIVAALFGFGPAEAEQRTTTGREKVQLHFFWSSACPHCAREKIYLRDLAEGKPQLEIITYEIWGNRENFELLQKLAKIHGVEAISTPATFVGERAWFGFSDTVATQIEAAVERCRQKGCRDPLALLAGEGDGEATENAQPTPPEAGETLVEIPLFGQFDARRLSLPLLTVVLGLLDSFNPCAFFVLLFLLGLLIHLRSRRRMLVVGGTFILISGLVYFVFMAAWLNLFLVVGHLRAITVTAGLLAVLIAAVNIKDFFFFKRGVSLSIPETAKPRLFTRMRSLLKASRLPVMLGATVVLAVIANAYELLCTAGFPMIYTRVLTLNRIEPAVYYLYLGLYNAVYILPLLVILLVVTATLSRRQLSEWHGRVLKLLSGMMMLFLGLSLVIDPDILHNVVAAVALLALSLLTTWLIVFLYGTPWKKRKTP